MAGFRSLRRQHDFTLLWVGETISELGSRVSMFVFPLIAYAQTRSTLAAGLAETANLLGVAAMLLPAGVLADRFDRRRIMRCASAVGLVLYLSLVVAIGMHRLSLVHLIVVSLGTGLAAGAFSPAEVSAVRTVVPSDLLPTALAQNQARQHVASLVGGPIGGALYGVTRWLPFAADAVSYAVSWVLLGRIRADLTAPARTSPRRRVRAELAEGVRFVTRHRFFRVLLVWSPLLNLTVNTIAFTAVLRLIQAGRSPVQIGLVETAAGVCGIAGAVCAPRVVRALPTGLLTVMVGWSWVPLAVPLMFFNTPLAAAVSLSVGIFLNPSGNSGIGAYRLHITPPELVGRVQSVSQFVSYLLLPLYPVVAGLALHRLGGPGAIALLVGLTAAVALIPTLSRAVRSVPRPAAWPQAAGSRTGGV
ncbi:MFS transporter [Allobranchiibius sp. GilTou38]|uniref:MFS transporter n=1 Tax=Allobranchiibius sp. GilTou38 TaxID=2815210 RepID=UPI001AA15E53|nr:MFS transporter [Allobranchiibius sp. GilTou38]MBO1765225.1 MFS transporter [Allobranchiibius sp. GilTou38]